MFSKQILDFRFFIGHTLDKESRLDIDQYIYNNLHQAQQNNFRVIIMGDFNVDPDGSFNPA